MCSKSVLLLAGRVERPFFFTEPILTHYVAFCNINSLEIFGQIKYTFIEIVEEDGQLAKYAYARTLNSGQSLGKQIQAFAQFGVEKSAIYADEKLNTRAAYGELLQVLKKGDLIVIKSLAALSDSYEGMSTEWTRLTSLGADVCVADMPALDTRLGGERGVIVSAVAQMLGFCAEKERAHSALQAKGIQSAKERGVRFGRPKTQYSEEFITAARRFKSGEITMKQALTLTGMKQSSFYYHIHKLESLNCFDK